MGNNRILTVAFFAFAAWLPWAPSAHAQAEQTPEHLLDEPLDPPQAEQESAEAGEEPPASRETDFNEENFRRSMELRDLARQRSSGLTTGTYSVHTGVDALDNLPESSQKHLRTQLREVIVRNGAWTPEQAGTVYPYVPSEAAQENGSLKKREQAAWAELVAKYHEREAAIHANTVGRQSATVDGTPGDARQQPGSEPGTAEREMASRRAGSAEGTTGKPGGNAAGKRGGAPEGEATRSVPVQGVSQNALELLTSRQQLPANTTVEEQRPAGEQGAAKMREGKDGEPQADPEIDLESEGVIAIDDLENVNLESDGDDG